MKPELSLHLSHIAIFFGVLLTGLGGFGSYYFGQKISSEEKQKSQSDQNRLEGKVSELLDGNEVLKEKLAPFEEIAKKIHPTLDLNIALRKLESDYFQLKEIAEKHKIKDTHLFDTPPHWSIFSSLPLGEAYDQCPQHPD